MHAQAHAERVNTLLQELARRYGVDVLFAVESGSRAWGFASPDSDFDVRFIYREPVDRMLRLFPDRDVIEEMNTYGEDGTGVPMDLVGWSLTKALRLGVSSNPQLCEWITSARSYHEEPGFRAEMQTLTEQSAPRTLAHHYRGLAKKTMHNHLAKPEAPVGKNYLYAVRSTLAAQYMLDHPSVGVSPPIVFEHLRAATKIDEEIHRQIEDLLDFKMGASEAGARQRFPVLDQWLAESQEHLAELIPDIPEHQVDKEIAEAIHLRHASSPPNAEAGREPVDDPMASFT